MKITYIKLSKELISKQKVNLETRISHFNKVKPSNTNEIDMNTWFKKINWMPLPMILATAYVINLGTLSTFAATSTGDTASADKIRSGFSQLIDVATAVAEPILWFYALTACILMATGRNKQMGWERLKQVAYSYVGISLLPTGFAFLRYVAHVLQSSFKL